MSKQSLARLCARIKINAGKGDRATADAKRSETNLEKLARQQAKALADAERHYIACGRDLIALREQLAQQTGNEKRVDFKRYVKAHCGMGHDKAYMCIRFAERRLSLQAHRTHKSVSKQRQRDTSATAGGRGRNNNVPRYSAANGVRKTSPLREYGWPEIKWEMQTVKYIQRSPSRGPGPLLLPS